MQQLQQAPHKTHWRKNKDKSKNQGDIKDMDLKEGDNVLCTVKKIESVAVFVNIEGNGEGSIVLPEIAAGRIRNLRAFVVPNKKIVCKVLNITKNNMELSLRRVTAKEREEVMDRYKKEKSFLSMLKTIATEPEKTLEKIKAKYEITDFLDEARASPNILQSFLPKQEAEKLANSIKEKHEKEKTTKKTIMLSSFSPSGLNDIKDILTTNQAEIHYLGSSKFLLQTKAQTFKQAEHKLDNLMEQIEKQAKQKHALFSIKDKK